MLFCNRLFVRQINAVRCLLSPCSLFDAPQAVENFWAFLVPTGLEGHGSAGRVKSAASWRGGSGATRNPFFTGEHGEHPPFDASEHRGTHSPLDKSVAAPKKTKAPAVETGAWCYDCSGRVPYGVVNLIPDRATQDSHALYNTAKDLKVQR
jgi:hypothetical protein